MRNIAAHPKNSKSICGLSAEIQPASRENRARQQKLPKSITLNSEYPSEFRAVPLMPSTAGGKFILRHFAVPPALADFLAAAAGIGFEDAVQ
jgi:hypothetical protein